MSSLQEIFIFDVMIDQTSLSESQEQSRTILQKTQIYSSFETQSVLPPKSTDDGFFESDDKEDDEESSKSSGTPRKSKKVEKAKRSRKLKQNSKWSKKDEIKYWTFYIFYKTRNPYLKVSWIQWKRDSIYKHMAEYIGKTSKQCKSKDQNMKSKQFGLCPGKDILEIAFHKLQGYKESDKQIKTILEEYSRSENQISKHMKMLDDKLQILKREKIRIPVLMEQFDMNLDQFRAMKDSNQKK